MMKVYLYHFIMSSTNQELLDAYLSSPEGKEKNEKFLAFHNQILADCEKANWDCVLYGISRMNTAIDECTSPQERYVGLLHFFSVLATATPTQNIRNDIFHHGHSLYIEKLCDSIQMRVKSMKTTSDNLLYINKTSLVERVGIIYDCSSDDYRRCHLR